ncbi:MAG TPA: translation elongation factor Ts [Gammaproteobacteria bacterium]|jgi:elongation factor Ts
MEVTPEMVKQLRDRTGAGMMDCKKALVEAAGDADVAADSLRKAGQAKADKKSGRVAAEGKVLVVSDAGAGYHALIEVNSETDFAANDANFRQFADLVGKLALLHKPKNLDDLMRLEAGGQSLEEARRALVAKVGENIAVRRIGVLTGKGAVGAYAHMNRIGALVELESANAELARDLAMQVAATSPRYVSIDDVPAADLAKEREIFSALAAQEGKPPEIVVKMVEGKLRKHFDEITLVGQQFVKDPDKRVRELLKAKGATVKRFLRYEVGEGIDKSAQA